MDTWEARLDIAVGNLLWALYAEGVAVPPSAPTIGWELFDLKLQGILYTVAQRGPNWVLPKDAPRPYSRPFPVPTAAAGRAIALAAMPPERPSKPKRGVPGHLLSYASLRPVFEATLKYHGVSDETAIWADRYLFRLCANGVTADALDRYITRLSERARTNVLQSLEGVLEADGSGEPAHNDDNELAEDTGEAAASLVDVDAPEKDDPYLASPLPLDGLFLTTFTDEEGQFTAYTKADPDAEEGGLPVVSKVYPEHPVTFLKTPLPLCDRCNRWTTICAFGWTKELCHPCMQAVNEDRQAEGLVPYTWDAQNAIR